MLKKRTLSLARRLAGATPKKSRAMQAMQAMQAAIAEPALAETPEIDELERAIVKASDEQWAFAGVSADEIERYRPSVVQLAKDVTDRMRAEYRARIKS